MTQNPWPELRWWDSGERQVVEEKIDELERKGIRCNPTRNRLYEALRATPFEQTRVCFIGQDPYPTSIHATGVAFSIPESIPGDKFPQTLRIVLAEYCSDLHLPAPSNGSLHSWCRQGVLLWNAIPSCQSGKPLSNDWDEWRYLTGEIVDRLSEKGGVVFICLGNIAASACNNVDLTRNRVIRTSHPSPRGIRSSKTPFTGSRIFSTCNDRLASLGREPINWELKDDPSGTSDGKSPELGRGNVLPNITGAKLGGLKRTGTSPNIYTSLVF